MVKKIFSVCAAVFLSLVFSVGVFASSVPLPDDVIVPAESLVKTFTKLTGLNYPYVYAFFVPTGSRSRVLVYHSNKPMIRVDILKSEPTRYSVNVLFADGANFYSGSYSAKDGFDPAVYQVSDLTNYGKSFTTLVYRPDSSVDVHSQTAYVPIFGNSGTVYLYENGVKLDRFFPGTPLLSEVVGELQVGAGGTLATRLGADLSTLVPFGIGLLALLTALPVLLRVLRRFLR